MFTLSVHQPATTLKSSICRAYALGMETNRREAAVLRLAVLGCAVAIFGIKLVTVSVIDPADTSICVPDQILMTESAGFSPSDSRSSATVQSQPTLCQVGPVDRRCRVGTTGEKRDNNCDALVTNGIVPFVQVVIPARDRSDLFLDRRRLPVYRGKNKRSRPRSKAEIEQERQHRWETTCREIDEIYGVYIAKLRRTSGQITASAYARFSTRFQDSIADQVRVILDHALTLGMYVPRELIFFDLAVRGFKRYRVGLQQFESALKSKKASVALFFSTSRLFRKQYRTLEFVDNVHKGLDVRCVFVKSGVDTDDKQQWETLLAVQSMIDQFVVTMNVANIQAAHEGLLRAQLVFGTLSFGYIGVPIDGEFTKLGRPRCKIAIDEETARFVRMIYDWYVRDLLSISEIIKRLNADPEIPLPSLARSGTWTRLSVRNVLKNTRYFGLWRYGVAESIYKPDGDYVYRKMRAEPLAQIQIDELRIIPDEIWYAAQARLATSNGNGGRPAKDGDRKKRPKLLNSLLFCGGHREQQLHTGGPYGNSMHCPKCARLPVEQRFLYTTLKRVLATQLICNKLAELVNSDDDLVRQVITACRAEAAECQKTDPKQLAQLRTQIERLGRIIEFTRRSAGDTATDQEDAQQAMAKFQGERAQLQSEMAALEAAQKTPPRIPTEAEVRGMIMDLGSKLAEAASLDPSAIGRAKRVVEELTGGEIVVYQMGERKRLQGWLQVRFSVALIAHLAQSCANRPTIGVDKPVEVILDIVPPRDDSELEGAWQLEKEGKLAKEIATALGCSRSKVTGLLKAAAAKHGEPYVDGRKRRSTLQKKHLEMSPYQRIADEVVELMSGNLLLEEIAEKLDVDRNTVTSAIRWWHEARGLPVPDGRSRLRNLNRKSLPRRAEAS